MTYPPSRSELAARHGVYVKTWTKAHRQAYLAGEFDQPCDHNEALQCCADPGCVADYEAIVLSTIANQPKRIGSDAA